MKYIVDTNVVSETSKASPHSGCVAGLLAHSYDSCITTVTLAEMRYGLERLPEGKKSAL
jgi:toxin FitB